MYAAYFGLTEPPFSIAPDPRYLYMSARHREAMAHLLYGIEQGGGFVQLTGEVGTGKTTLCRLLLSNLPDNVEVALILNPRIDELELLRAICDELRIECPPAARAQELLGRLNQHLLDVHAAGRRTVLVVDESQNLTREVLEQIRLLTNLETTKQKLLQIILIGQPELAEVLAGPNLRQLAQRITARYHLLPLSRPETAAYIAFRLSVAGRAEPLFTNRAIRGVYRLSKGVPRLINVICDRALLGAYGRNRSSVDRAIVRQAAREVLGEVPDPGGFNRWAGWVAGLAIVALMTGLVAFREDVAAIADRAAARWLSERSESESPAPASGEPVVAAPVPAPEQAPSVSDPADDYPFAPDLALRLEIPPVAGSASRIAVEGVPLQSALVGSADSYRDAVKRLVELWGGRPELVEDCASVGRVGLQCLAKSGDWASLSELNRPAILGLSGAGGTSAGYLVITALEGDSVVADVSRRAYRFQRTEIDRYWDGRFTLLWRPLPSRSGAADMELDWLRQAMSRWSSRAGGPELGATPDENRLRDHLKAFQREHRLAVTGELEVDTIIQLNSLLNGGEIPVLTN